MGNSDKGQRLFIIIPNATKSKGAFVFVPYRGSSLGA
jgi:hypothetical protein